MSVNAIGSMSGTTGGTDATTELQRAQRKLTSDLAAKTAAAKVLAEDRDAVARAQQAAQAAEAVEAARRAAEQQVLPVAPTPQQQSRPVTASASALGGSFDVTV
jgi:septal ring factor EnvC (AmiA/AmiB activator)